LTDQLLHLLAPFNPQFSNGNADAQSAVAIWRNLCEDWFITALKLKAKLLLSTNWYELVMFPPGTSFDSRCMKTSSKVPTNATVKVCLFPALFTYGEEEYLKIARRGASEPSFSEFIVQSSNFIRTDHSLKADRSPISKAGVVLED
jgi:hypothetical protein